MPFLGAAMAITAFPVLARILEERGLTKSPLGVTALICAAMNDVSAWCILALVVAIAKARSLGAAGFSIALVVVFVAVMREGSEIVLFLYGIVVAGTSTPSLLAGGLLGLLAGAMLSALSYYGLIAIPTRHIFRVTTVLLALLAAGMAAQAIRFLQAAGVVTALHTRVWDTSWLLSESSILGRMLHVLIGYTDKPTALQLIAYVATLATMAVLIRLVRTPRPAKPA